MILSQSELIFHENNPESKHTHCNKLVNGNKAMFTHISLEHEVSEKHRNRLLMIEGTLKTLIGLAENEAPFERDSPSSKGLKSPMVVRTSFFTRKEYLGGQKNKSESQENIISNQDENGEKVQENEVTADSNPLETNKEEEENMDEAIAEWNKGRKIKKGEFFFGSRSFVKNSKDESLKSLEKTPVPKPKFKPKSPKEGRFEWCDPELKDPEQDVEEIKEIKVTHKKKKVKSYYPPQISKNKKEKDETSQNRNIIMKISKYFA